MESILPTGDFINNCEKLLALYNTRKELENMKIDMPKTFEVFNIEIVYIMENLKEFFD